MKDYLLLFDKNENLKRIINNYEFFKDEYKTTVKGEVIFEFRIKDNVTDISREDKVGIFKEDGAIDLLIVDQVEAETIYSTEYKVTCLHDFYSIQEEKAITQYESKSISLRDALTEMLKGTSYELGECVEVALKPLGPYLFKNVLWCIQDILKVFGVEVYYSIELDTTRTKISKKKLNVVNALGSDTGIRCSTDLNVSKIKRIEKNKFYTVLYGCGAEYQKDLVKYKYSFKDIESTNPVKPKGLEYVEDKEAIEKYGRKIGIFEDSRIKDPNLLLKYTWEALKANNKPIPCYELELQELKFDDGYEHLNFKLGDMIILHNTIDDTRAKFRIVEYNRQISNPKNVKITVGEQIRGLTSSGGNSNNNGNIGSEGGGTIIDPDDGSLDDLTPDILPAIPVVEAYGLWETILLDWTYEDKMYYTYEVYASQIKDFEPTTFNLIFSGKASSFSHKVKPKQTWYYRVRAVNTHGSSTEFSLQVQATTTKLSDGAEYFEEAAIGHALIKDLDADKIITGTLDANKADVVNLNASNIITGTLLGKLVEANTVSAKEIKVGNTHVDGERVKVAHLDGSYTQMASNGFKRYVGSSEKDYHYLTAIGTVNVGDENGGTSGNVVIHLGNEFKNKKYTVTLSIAGFPNAGYKKPVCQTSVWASYIETGETPNFTINAYCAVFDFNSGAQKNVPIKVSYTVVA